MRTFVAVELNDACLSSLERAYAPLLDKISNLQGVRLSTPAANKLHLTLQFLGDFREEHISKFEVKLNEVLTAVPQIELEFSFSGCFPRQGSPRVIWIGCTKGNEQLQSISKDVAKVSSYFGYKAEQRKFHAHATIARVKQDTSRGELRRLVEAYSFPPVFTKSTSICLYHSLLKPQGAHYEVIFRSRLRT